MTLPLFIGNIGMTEILIILVIVIIFFGGKKIPELMRGMGQGVREFKDAMEAKPEEKKTEAQQPTKTPSEQDSENPSPKN